MTKEEQLVVARRACGSYGGNHRLPGILKRNAKEDSIYVAFLRVIKKNPWDWAEYERLVRAIVAEHPDPFGTGRPVKLGPSPAPKPAPKPSPPDLRPDPPEDREPLHGESEEDRAPEAPEGQLDGLQGSDVPEGPAEDGVPGALDTGPEPEKPTSWRGLLWDAVRPGE